VIVYDELQGVSLLDKACTVLTQRCVTGIKANTDRDANMVKGSIGVVTALNPVLGYEKSAAIAKEALQTGRPVYDLILEKGWLSKEKLDDLLKPENMTQPREWQGVK
ncbi:MAG: aspartate ammonia-lyase, partial [Verrucomicrobia bacterium]|nr:aspartate ammonia-lyase [Verrucomicrobiota bacterium]